MRTSRETLRVVRNYEAFMFVGGTSHRRSESGTTIAAGASGPRELDFRAFPDDGQEAKAVRPLRSLRDHRSQPNTKSFNGAPRFTTRHFRQSPEWQSRRQRSEGRWSDAPAYQIIFGSAAAQIFCRRGSPLSALR